MKNTVKRVYMALIFIFLYAPIVTLIVLSFNASTTRAVWGGFSLKWYISLFSSTALLNACYNTLTIALIASLCATLIGTLAAIGINACSVRLKPVLTGVANVPMLNAEIVTGISLMLLFISAKVRFGFGTVLLAHITFNIPYVILSVLPRLFGLSPSTYEAALDLGASKLQAFFKVTLYELMPGILSGFLLSFTMSIDDFIITYFTRGAGLDTISTRIYTEVRKGIKPEVYSLSSLIFIIVLVLLMAIYLLPSKIHHPKDFSS